MGSDIDAYFGHGLRGHGVDGIGRGGACGEDGDVRPRQGAEPSGGHLRTAGIVHAEEDGARHDLIVMARTVLDVLAELARVSWREALVAAFRFGPTA